MSSGDFVTQALTTVGSTPGIHPDATQASQMTIGFSGAAFTVSGTFAGTVSFFATADGGTNWAPCNVAPSNSTTPVVSATAPGLFRANVSGYTHVSAQLSALTSGTPTVSIHCSSDAASSLSAGGTSGGGGGPGITLTTTGTTGASTYNSGTGALNVPNYSDISHLNLTTTGRAGGATLAAGTLNVPIYAPGTINQAQITTPSSVSSSSISWVSTGYGVAFQATYSTSILITYNFLVNAPATNSHMWVGVYRTTGAIPALGAAVGTDVQLFYSSLWTPPTASGGFSSSGAFYDTNITVGTPYNYYMAIQASSGSVSLNSSSIFQVTEAK